MMVQAIADHGGSQCDHLTTGEHATTKRTLAARQPAWKVSRQAHELMGDGAGNAAGRRTLKGAALRRIDGSAASQGDKGRESHPAGSPQPSPLTGL